MKHRHPPTSAADRLAGMARDAHRPLPVRVLRRLARLRSRAMMEHLAAPHPAGVQRLVSRWNRPDGAEPGGGLPPGASGA